MIGKWGVGSEPGVSLPNAQGFEEAYGFPDDMTAHEHFPPALWRNGKREDLPENIGGMHGRYANDLFADEAVRFIQAHRDRPFFLYLPFTIPHAQLEAPRAAVKEYAGKFPEKAWLGAAEDDPFAPYYPTPVLEPNATRAAMITRLDGYVGRILETLGRQGLERNTLVIFTSDNGPSDEGGSDLAFFHSTGPFTGAKQDLREGAIREPLIARWPGVIAPGRVEHTPVAFWDFLPTFNALAHAPAAPGDGVSIVPLLTGRAHDLGARSFYWEFGGHTPDGQPQVKQAIRRGDLKALRLSRDQPVRLFDLAADPAEQHDLAGQRPREAAQFKAELDSYLRARAKTDASR